MTISVFFEFEANFPKSDLDHIFGADILADELQKFILDNGFEIVENDLWRDIGWFIDCKYSDAGLSIWLGKYGENERWEMTIEPTEKLSIFSRLLGKKQKPYLTEMKNLTSLIQNYLTNHELVSTFNVCLSTNVKNTSKDAGDLEW